MPLSYEMKVTERVLQGSATKTAELAYMYRQALHFELSELFTFDAVPALTKRLIAFEPLLLQVEEGDRLEFAPQGVALVAGGDKVLIGGGATIKARLKMIFCGCIAGC